jgi:uncharacterized protein YqeY
MGLKDKIFADMKAAMKAGDVLKRETLRLLDAMIKNTEIEKMKKEKGLTDEEIISVIQKAVKQRKDSVDLFKKGGRTDLAEKEEGEIAILTAYLPEQMSEAEVQKKVKTIIKQAGVTSKAEMGKVMGMAMGQLKGQADGNLVRKIVEAELK